MELTKERVHVYFVQRKFIFILIFFKIFKNFFKICDYLNVKCIEKTFKIYTFLHIKKHYFIRFCCLFLKPSKAFSVSLINLNIILIAKKVVQKVFLLNTPARLVKKPNSKSHNTICYDMCYFGVHKEYNNIWKKKSKTQKRSPDLVLQIIHKRNDFVFLSYRHWTWNSVK